MQGNKDLLENAEKQKTLVKNNSALLKYFINKCAFSSKFYLFDRCVSWFAPAPDNNELDVWSRFGTDFSEYTW
jgi:hypothetical protein